MAVLLDFNGQLSISLSQPVCLDAQLFPGVLGILCCSVQVCPQSGHTLPLLLEVLREIVNLHSNDVESQGVHTSGRQILCVCVLYARHAEVFKLSDLERALSQAVLQPHTSC